MSDSTEYTQEEFLLASVTLSNPKMQQPQLQLQQSMTLDPC